MHYLNSKNIRNGFTFIEITIYISIVTFFLSLIIYSLVNIRINFENVKNSYAIYSEIDAMRNFLFKGLIKEKALDINTLENMRLEYSSCCIKLISSTSISNNINPKESDYVLNLDTESGLIKIKFSRLY